MSEIQEEVAENKQFDLIQLILHSAKHSVPKRQPDGTIENVYETDYDSLYWRTQSVSSPQFGELSYRNHEFLRMGLQAYRNMSSPRAEALLEEIREMCTSIKRCVDAKNSEALRGNNVVVSTLIDKVHTSSMDKTLHVDGAEPSMLAKLLGRGDSEQA